MDNFMREPFDLKRFVILSARKMWMLVVAVLFCSLLFGGFYVVKEVCFDGADEYSCETLYHINFDQEQVGDVHDYYNDYTWNDVLDSDQIAGKAASISGIKKEVIVQATEIPTMSDIRFFWVVVTADSERTASQIGKAVEQAVLAFGDETEGFQSIEVYDRISTYQVENQTYIVRWFVFGAVVGLVVGFLYLLYENAMDDSMYVEADVEKRFGILCLGVTGKKQKKDGEEYLELKANLSNLLEGKKKIAFAESYGNALKDPVTGEDVLTQEFLQEMVDAAAKESGQKPVEAKKVSYIKGKERDYFMQLREADSIIWLLPFGREDGTKLDRAWKNLHFWSCTADAAILTSVSMSYYRAYYAGKKRRKDRK